ncbi:hypothetical protein FVR03_09525 [Pontibacter qinzhouensis]|uniref:Uncharacterized protein n=1 Tax=Pontibacter qinzhouensis TaxID=2603253 RepID=A0A5C8K6I0_9BACT|nr:hypothetical protein [Pontibacter qinzhouensis]TXK47427.1 hypothetical protein FVR03_09525 [Pontibacter qinzhouensis]
MNRNTMIVVVIAFTVSALFGFKQYEQTAAAPKELMTILASISGRSITINISSTSTKTSFVQKKTKSESDGDYSSVLQLVKAQQNNGWQLKSSNYSTSNEAGSDSYLYFLLEK